MLTGRVKCYYIAILLILLGWCYIKMWKWEPRSSRLTIKASPNSFEDKLRTFQAETCKQVCQTSEDNEAQIMNVEGSYTLLPVVKKLTKNFECDKLWSDNFIDSPGEHKKAPKVDSASLRRDFSYHSRLEVREMYINEVGDTVGRAWNKEMIKDMVGRYQKGQLSGLYGSGPVEQMRGIIAKGKGQFSAPKAFQL